MADNPGTERTLRSKRRRKQEFPPRRANQHRLSNQCQHNTHRIGKDNRRMSFRLPCRIHLAATIALTVTFLAMGVNTSLAFPGKRGSWVKLYNGKDLAGWHTEGDRAKLEAWHPEGEVLSCKGGAM